MLRLYPVTCKKDDGVEISEKSLIIGDDIWKDCISILDECDKNQIELFPIRNKHDELIAYGYQDNEANRELRMLKELRNNTNALQFTDVFPEYKEVIIYGCNELAVSFAKYLQTQGGGIRTLTIGQYWDCFGFKNKYELEEKEDTLKIYAEGFSTKGDLYHTLERSVSSEFECIDKIYEANVLEGRIQDTIGSFDDLICRLRNEQEIVILGIDREAQDTYDLLLKHGIDICAFAVKEKRREALLGKKVMCISEAMSSLHTPVFLNYKDKHGALGEKLTEYFDYRGYERNKQFFLLRDYVDIPTSNLVHILHGKSILLTGDQKLCQMLSDYLYSVEKGKIHIKYMTLGETVTQKSDVLCLVIPDYHNDAEIVARKKKLLLEQSLSDMGFDNYTEYYINSHVFALIDIYLNQNIEKYSVSELLPKGMLLGRIPGWSGNIFIKGVLDGHSEILMISSFNDFNNNLFYYCIRLAGMDSADILQEFWTMYNYESSSKEQDFPNVEKFNESMKKYLKLKKRFTSQELFVLFHIAYAEMISGEVISDISEATIYWEPHLLSRDEFPFLALWLEDEKINGQTLVLRRNNIVRTGSACARRAQGRPISNAYTTMFEDGFSNDKVSVQYHNWIEFKMRFEDIKLYPKENLMKICERLGIAWSNSMLKTTCAGKILEYRGSVDFDLKPVFNRYDDFLSEFDCFRISLACSPYQKRFGYPYENCLKFTRNELQELFIKPFLFDEIKVFGDWDRKQYLKIFEWMRWKLWEVRKHMILNDIYPEFEKIQLKQHAITVNLNEFEEKK